MLIRKFINVAILADWCGACQQFKPIWHSTIKTFMRENGIYPVGIINASHQYYFHSRNFKTSMKLIHYINNCVIDVWSFNFFVF